MEEPNLTMVSLVMADRFIKHPRGIIEDVLVKVDKFVFLVDFIVLDMEEDKNILIILGRPFLAIGGAIIDVKHGKHTLQVNDEKVTFNVCGSIRCLHEDELYFQRSVFRKEYTKESNSNKQPP